MSRKLYATPTFDRMAREFIAKHSYLVNKFHEVLKRLSNDIFDPKLKTHKLHGPLKDFYACRVSYDQRIVFSFNDDCVTLRSVGSHNDVY